MIKRFPDERRRRLHIVWHQLYGLCLTERCVDSTAFMLYDTAWNDYNNLVRCDNLISLVKEDQNKALEFIHKNFKEYNEYSFLGLKESEETGEIMKFDVVIGNPPYNNDIYIPFVELGHHLADKCSVFITPAKWQAKGGKQNEHFRDTVVPYMSKIVYYPYCSDIFNIWEPSGIVYYLINKTEVKDKYIKNMCSTQPLFNSEENRCLGKDFTLFNIGSDIIKGLGKVNAFDRGYYQNNNGRYQVWMNNQSSGGGLFALSKGSLLVLEPASMIDTGSENERSNKASTSVKIFASDNKGEVVSFYTWINTKFIRFLVMLRLCVLTGILNEYAWRFVPHPNNWTVLYEDNTLEGYTPDENGIYTDDSGIKHCSLYAKYKLTPDKINMIESIIKERK